MRTGEFALIREYFAELSVTENAGGVALGIGDDAAILTPSPGKQLVAAVDTLVEGVHFPQKSNGELVARRALRVNLSDMAAMGAYPRWFTLALTLPDASSDWLRGFSRGLAKDARDFNCVLVGGDTTRGPLTVSIQMLGEVETGKALTRSGAAVGDLVYITGTLGAAAAAVEILQADRPSAREQMLLDRYYLPQPRIAEGVLLQNLASAAIDISDGLLADLGHIAERSQVGARLYVEKLPIFQGLDTQRAQGWALAGGDDYELCFTLPPEKQRQLQDLVAKGELAATAVGEIVDGNGVVCLDRQARVLTPNSLGYQHF